MISIGQFGVGAVIAAGIAGGFSILGLVIAKEQKVSDFRREWVEELRGDLSKFLAHADFFLGLHSYAPQAATEAMLITDFRTELIAMLETSTRIRLKLDKSDPDAASILRAMAAIEDAIRSAEPRAIDRIAELESALVDHSRTLLRREWRRVRQGEGVYRATKVGAFALTGAAIITGIAGIVWLV